jgi:two-component system, chemotaxis family, chemotaxis protein CheY
MPDKSIRIAVVDDDETFQFITLKAIRSVTTTNQVLQFLSGLDAIKFLAENAHEPESLPDVMLLDINMPVLDGWMFMDEFSTIKEKLNKPINIFMVSSSIDASDIARAKQNKNIADYLMKPISLDKFRELLTTALS